MKKKILFISHEASRTGSPFILLYFLNWLKIKKADDFTVHVLLLKEGELKQDFENTCDRLYTSVNVKKSLFKKGLDKLLSLIKQTKNKTESINSVLDNNYDLIYANSIPSLSIASKIKNQSKKSKVLLHVHELDTVIRMFISEKDNVLQEVDKFIAVSNLVKNDLVNKWHVNKEKIQVIYEFSNIKQKDLKKESKTFIVGASGAVEWRKGDDAFIQVARYVNKKYPDVNIKFVWVGRNNKQSIVEADLKKMNLSEKVDFVGEQKNPFAYYNEFDVFLMTSREDPFPLVCIEVASLKKPIICFEGATGTQEILINGGGSIVPYLDIELMAESVMFYYNNRDKVIQDGEKAQELFSKFTPELSCPMIYERINELLKNI